MDVTNIDSIRDTFAFYSPEFVIHAAATKYIHLAEEYPNECVDINIKGAQNIARVAFENKVKGVIGISTDKVNNMNSFYGLSKKVMENLYTLLDKEEGTRFTCVRLGNLAWSTGSVFPIWKEMLETTNQIQTTGYEMKRFFTRIDEALNLITMTMNNLSLTGGNIVCASVKVAQMKHVLDDFIKFFGGTYTKVSKRRGESFKEIMINEDEAPYTVELTINHSKFFLIDKRKLQSPQKIYMVTTEEQQEMNRTEIRNLINKMSL